MSSARALRARWCPRLLAAFAVCAALGVAAAASAGPDDRAAAEAVLKELDASPKKDAAGELIAKAKAALDRSARLRAAGDEAHAKIADSVARTWAEAARDIVRAVAIEEKAHEARRAATDAGAIADRERALLEEAIAQSGRLRAQLDGLERESKESPARTSTSTAGGDAGAKPAPPPKTAPSDRSGLPKDGGAR